ncbi:MAG TPA: site-specific integrase [Burkholderiales bacterium]|nr:site-specific integrase [Burkholderiales bacterium]
MAVVRRAGSRSWYIQFQWRHKLYIRSARTTNKRLAEQLEAEWRAQIYRQQQLGERERITMEGALDLFCRSKERTPHHPALVANKKAVLASITGGKRLDDLSRQDLERFRHDREAAGLSPQTIKHGIGLIRCAVVYAKAMGYHVPDIAFPVIKIPRYKERYLSAAEEAKLLECLDPRRERPRLAPYDRRPIALRRAMQDAYDLTVCLLDTGCRYSEMAKIEWVRIDLENRSIQVWRQKTHTETLIFMTDRVAAILTRRRAHAPASRWVFESKSGGPRGYAAKAIMKALRAAAPGATIHTLRHSCASKLIRNGLSIYEVAAILGHSSPATTQRYAHLERRDVSLKARDVINRLNERSEPV